MSDRNTLTRSLHDLGAAAWFGGSLMGAVGLNGAASTVSDPAERLTVSTAGWARWTPVQIAAIAVHSVGGVAQIVGNRKRVLSDPATQANTALKAVLTVAAMGASAYAGVLGKQIDEQAHEGAVGATEPSANASDKLAGAQRQLKAIQWVIPALTGTLVVLGAQQGEQQRGLRGLLDR